MFLLKLMITFYRAVHESSMSKDKTKPNHTHTHAHAHAHAHTHTHTHTHRNSVVTKRVCACQLLFMQFRKWFRKWLQTRGIGTEVGLLRSQALGPPDVKPRFGAALVRSAHLRSGYIVSLPRQWLVTTQILAELWAPRLVYLQICRSACHTRGRWRMN